MEEILVVVPYKVFLATLVGRENRRGGPELEI